MPLAFEVIGGRITNAGSTLTAYTMNTGDSTTIRNFAPGSGAWCLSMWGLSATAGYQQVHSPRWHDDVQGVKQGLIAADSRPGWNYGARQALQPQDVLVFQGTGGGSETDTGYLLNYYNDLPGVASRLLTLDAVRARSVNLVSVQTSHTSSGTAGDWGGQVAINSSTQLLKANTDYAILGYMTSVNCGAVGYRGSDTGNLRVGGSGSTIRTVTRDWFVTLSEQVGLPCIPVFNAANAGGFFVDISVPATSTSVVVQTFMAQLS